METKKLTTPTGKVLELKEFVTGKEKREYRSFLLQLESKEDTTSAQRLDLGEDKIMELVVISYDGSSDNLTERIVNSRDYDFVFDACRKVFVGMDDKKKVTSDTSTSNSSEENPQI